MKLHQVPQTWLACMLMACAAVAVQAKGAGVEDLGTVDLVGSLSVPEQSADTESDTKAVESDEPSIVGEEERDQVEVGRRGRRPSIQTNGFFTMSTSGGAAGGAGEESNEDFGEVSNEELGEELGEESANVKSLRTVNDLREAMTDTSTPMSVCNLASICRKITNLATSCSSPAADSTDEAANGKEAGPETKAAPTLLSSQQDRTKFMILSSTNYAAGKPASQSAAGLVTWAAAGAVDGGSYTWPKCNQAEYDSQKTTYMKSGSLCTNAAAAVSSVTATNPWWEVDLQTTAAVKMVRVTGRLASRRSDLLKITVTSSNGDSSVCQENVVAPWGWPVDVECNPAISGNKVKLELSGVRALELAEVEVFEKGRTGGNKAQKCYDGVRYATEACAECTGPGPNQCTRCNDDAVLVPFRAANHASDTYRSAGFEGSCSKYTRDIQVLDLPGAATTAASLLPSISTKWVEVSTSALLPAKSSTGFDAIEVGANCLMYKVVWCAARAKATQALSCKVFKAGRIKSVRKLSFPVKALGHVTINPHQSTCHGNCDACQVCTNAGGFAWNGCASCGKQEADNSITHKAPPVANLLDLVDLASEDEACHSAVKLL